MPVISLRSNNAGFTLAELAIVLVIVALLTGGFLMSLSAQREVQAIRDTEARLASIQEALLGFAAANGRLPCPATSTSNGQETFCSAISGACTQTYSPPDHGRCAAPFDGFLPGATLGLRPINDQGQLIDAWNNPIRYAVSTAQDGSTSKYSFTASNGMREQGLPNLAPDLRICSTATGIKNGGTASADCADPASTFSNGAVAVIYSLGPNAASGGAGTDEAANPNSNSAVAADRVFVSHPPTAAGAANGEFDDLVVWLSPNILYNRMIAAGRLP